MEQYVFELNLLSSTSLLLISKNFVERLYGYFCRIQSREDLLLELKERIFRIKNRPVFRQSQKYRYIEIIIRLTHIQRPEEIKQRNTLKQRFKLKVPLTQKYFFANLNFLFLLIITAKKLSL